MKRHLLTAALMVSLSAPVGAVGASPTWSPASNDFYEWKPVTWLTTYVLYLAPSVYWGISKAVGAR